MSVCSAPKALAERRWARAAYGASFALTLAGVARAAPRPDPPGLVFRFDAGSSLFAGPGVGSEGELYVGSGDGYVHALGRDGSYRWSYTLRGRVVAPPVFDATTGRLFVATSDARLYALERDATLRWVFALPVAVNSEVVLTSKGTLLFVGTDEHLYGVTTGGALVLRLSAPGARSAPAQLRGGGSALILNGSFATLKGYGFERRPVGVAFGPLASLALGADGAIFACQEGSGQAYPEGSKPELSLSENCLSPPVPGDGFFAIAESNGGVRLVAANRSETTFVLGGAPLRPLWDAPRRRLVMSTALGAITVVEIPPLSPKP